MREILFRGKTSKGEWIYGFYMNKGVKDIIVDTTRGSLGFGLEVDGETVGQYTGLNDKNGNKIFEGDIVKAIQTEYDEYKENEPFIFSFVGEMIFDDACFGLKAKNGIGFYSPMWKEEDVELEVIGNITDNPELLEENL